MHKKCLISIIGRPNVGKSTLFNKLVGRKLAIVDDTPGVTRDRKEADGNIGPYEFSLIDTPGLEEQSKDNIFAEKMMQQTTLAIQACNIILFIVDGLSGIKDADKYYANWIRKFNKPILLVMNKCENSSKIDHACQDVYKIGFGEPIYISAEHKLGFNDLIENLSPLLESFEQQDDILIEHKPDFIQLSIAGKPNVGKSTLINALLNQDRMIVSDIAGTTRDAVSIDWTYGNYHIKLVDTAGMRKRAKVHSKLEKLSVTEAQNAINYSHIVVVMIDATSFLEQQDLSIIDYAVKEGRGVVIAVNKWDKIKNPQETKKNIIERVEDYLKSIDGVHIEYISALHTENLDKLLKSVISTYEMWNKRIATADLNKWIQEVTESHPIPLNSRKKRPKIKFVTQYKSRPPSFMLHSNYADDIDLDYQRYLINSLRSTFKMIGVPIRLNFKKSSNPYIKKV